VKGQTEEWAKCPVTRRAVYAVCAVRCFVTSLYVLKVGCHETPHRAEIHAWVLTE